GFVLANVGAEAVERGGGDGCALRIESEAERILAECSGAVEFEGADFGGFTVACDGVNAGGLGGGGLRGGRGAGTGLVLRCLVRRRWIDVPVGMLFLQVSVDPQPTAEDGCGEEEEGCQSLALHQTFFLMHELGAHAT